MEATNSYESDGKGPAVLADDKIEAALPRNIENTPTEEFSDAKGTVDDRKDMKRLGKEQEMRRNFQKFSTLSFTCIIMATYEVLLIANYQGLQNGGRAGFFWSYVWTFAGFAPIIVSLAEMSSM
jgi:hypothetical protein